MLESMLESGVRLDAEWWTLRNSCEVAIVGSGPAGSSAALALAREGVQVDDPGKGVPCRDTRLVGVESLVALDDFSPSAFTRWSSNNATPPN